MSKLSYLQDFYAVVKMNAYGHGWQQIVDRLWDLGQRHYCVDSLYEALQIKSVHRSAHVFVMSYMSSKHMTEAFEAEVVPFFFSESQKPALKGLSRTSPAQIVFHCDCGMSRFGWSESQRSSAWSFLRQSSIQVHSVSTHMAFGDQLFKEKQASLGYQNFLSWAVEAQKQTSCRVQALNTSSVLSHLQAKEKILAGIRIGLGLYGWCCEEGFQKWLPLRPVMSCWAPIVGLRQVKQGDSVSYGGQWVAPRNSEIAVVAVGYGDGFTPPKGHRNVFIKGQIVEIVGRVSMSYTMVDVTKVRSKLKEGDKVLVFGDHHLSSNSDPWPYYAMTGLGTHLEHTYE